MTFTGNPGIDAKNCFRRFDEDGNGYLDIYGGGGPPLRENNAALFRPYDQHFVFNINKNGQLGCDRGIFSHMLIFLYL